MESILLGLRPGHAHEEQPGKDAGTRAYLELVLLVGNDDPTQGVGPPCAQLSWLEGVDDDLFPCECHRNRLAPSNLTH